MWISNEPKVVAIGAVICEIIVRIDCAYATLGVPGAPLESRSLQQFYYLPGKPEINFFLRKSELNLEIFVLKFETAKSVLKSEIEN